MMKTAFADSSALVKRYVVEDHTAIVRELEELTVSALAGVEVASAIWRRARVDRALEADVRLALRRLQQDLRGGTVEAPGYGVIHPTDRVLRDATEIVREHPMGALDAIQLASAVIARELTPECTDFVCFDRRLREAAAAHGFALVPA